MRRVLLCLDHMILNYRYNPQIISLESWSLIEIFGADTERFLQGQLTNDLDELNGESSQLTARVDRSGKIVSYGYLSKGESKYYYSCPSILADKLIEDLEKFIIMDDVTLQKLEQKLFFIHPLLNLNKNDFPVMKMDFAGVCGTLVFGEGQREGLVGEESLNDLRLLAGEPILNLNIAIRDLLNNTPLENKGISYKKGCFLGQETLAKINTNRGASHLFALLETGHSIDSVGDLFLQGEKAGKVIKKCSYRGKTYLYSQIKRKYKVDNRKEKWTLDNIEFEATLRPLPLFKAGALANDFYEVGINLYHEGKNEDALVFIENAMALDPQFEDAFEVYGVIQGQLGHYEEGLKVMDQLLSLNPKSIMAHTNKSLFYMRMGNIELAEKEKGEATFKSFSLNAQEAANKRELEQQKQQKLEQMEKRKGMFLQVLAIDKDDIVANLGLGEISFETGKLEDAETFLNNVVSRQENSKARLLLGKLYHSLKNDQMARGHLEKGISWAGEKGELMLANQMQFLLNQLSE